VRPAWNKPRDKAEPTKAAISTAPTGPYGSRVVQSVRPRPFAVQSGLARTGREVSFIPARNVRCGLGSDLDHEIAEQRRGGGPLAAGLSTRQIAAETGIPACAVVRTRR
jgi:hypothetical protein